MTGIGDGFQTAALQQQVGLVGAADGPRDVELVEASKLRDFTNDAHGLANHSEILLERLLDLIGGLEGEPPTERKHPPSDSLAGLEGLGDAEQRISSALNGIADGLGKLESLVRL